MLKLSQVVTLLICLCPSAFQVWHGSALWPYSFIELKGVGQEDQNEIKMAPGSELGELVALGMPFLEGLVGMGWGWYGVVAQGAHCSFMCGSVWCTMSALDLHGESLQEESCRGLALGRSWWCFLRCAGKASSDLLHSHTDASCVSCHHDSNSFHLPEIPGFRLCADRL